MSCGLYDVVALEGRGIPAVLVATDVFGPEADEQLRLLGQPSAMPVEVPHPVQPLAPETVAGFVDRVLPAAVARLTGR